MRNGPLATSDKRLETYFNYLMKIVFFGSDDFALAHLKALYASKHQVFACIIQPDRPKGRGMKTVALPIKEFALEKRIKVFQPVDYKDKTIVDELKKINADVFVVIAYGVILPQDVLDIPKMGSINVHASLLPKYRGAAPVNWVILNGEKETGVSIIKMNAKMDAGDIVAQEKLKIFDNESAFELRQRLMNLGVSLLVKTLEGGINQAKSQDAKQVTFAPKLSKELGQI